MKWREVWESSLNHLNLRCSVYFLLNWFWPKVFSTYGSPFILFDKSGTFDVIFKLDFYSPIQIRLDQISRSVVSDCLRPHESQHTRPPCPSPTPRVHSDSRPSSQWCHPDISSSVVPSPPAPNPSQHQSLLQWVNSLHEVAKVLEFQL